MVLEPCCHLQYNYLMVIDMILCHHWVLIFVYSSIEQIYNQLISYNICYNNLIPMHGYIIFVHFY